MNLNGNANIPAARVTAEQFTHGGKYPRCNCHTTALGKLTFIIFKITYEVPSYDRGGGDISTKNKLLKMELLLRFSATYRDGNG